MNKCYSETDFGNLIKSIEFNICIILLKCFVEFLSVRYCLWDKQMSCLLQNMFNNQKRSIISTHVLTIEISKSSTYVQ